MRIKNDSPFVCGSIVTSRRPPTPELVVVVRGTFTLVPDGVCTLVGDLLAQGPLSGERFVDEDDRASPLAYPGDFAPWKPEAEVILKGTCHATPGDSASGKPASGVGAPRAASRVGGPGGLAPTGGGAGDSPSGKRECPVELALGSFRKRLRVVGDRRWLDARTLSEPLPFSKLPLDWTRAARGPENPTGAEIPNVELAEHPLRRRDTPIPPASFDAVHPDAPSRRDRWGKDWGESYRKSRAPFFASDFDFRAFQAAPADQRLPSIEPDARLSLLHLDPELARLDTQLPGLFPRAFVKSRGREGREVPLRLDTVYVESDQRRVTLTWRGLVEIAEDDLSDVSSLFVAGCSLAEPGDAAALLATLAAFDADPVGMGDALAKATEAVTKEAEALGARDAQLADDVAKTLGGGAAAGAVADVLARALAHGKRGVDLRALVAEAAAAKAPPAAAATGGVPTVAKQGIARALDRAAASSSDVVARAAVAEAHAKLGQVEVGHDALGPGADLRGRDLSGQDLSGRDLSGAKLQEVNLSGAKLTDANLSGADLTAAILTGADLERANLREATLTSVDATGASFVAASLEGARLDGASLSEANLSFANLRGSRAARAVFGKAVLRGASLAGAALEQVDFQEADLGGAALVGAGLERCFFLKANLAGADLSEARLGRTAFSEANLADARLVGATGRATVWLSAHLERADLSFAELHAAVLDGATLGGARLFGADLRCARLLRANLDGADLARANLFEADLRKTSVRRTSFVGASLFAAAIHGMRGDAGTRLEGANLERVTGGTEA
jgi:uncharacterized protein YjbI with pentapeptide repeats